MGQSIKCYADTISELHTRLTPFILITDPSIINLVLVFSTVPLTVAVSSVIEIEIPEFEPGFSEFSGKGLVVQGIIRIAVRLVD